MKIPDVIYLQWQEEEDVRFEVVTWSEVPDEDTDPKYLLATPVREAAEAMLQALTKLANEAQGFLNMAEASEAGLYAHGITNMRVMQQKIDAARAAIAAAEAGKEQA